LKRGRMIGLVLVVAGIVAFAVLVSVPDLWEGALRALFPEYREVLHPRGTLAQFTLEHIALVLVSSGLTVLIGVPLGIAVTRPWGAQFRSLVVAATDLGQTFPPVAVLALAMPVLGFGFWPTIIALF